MSTTAYIAEQGLRSRMEDTHVLIPDFFSPGWILGAVFDGHRGSRAAEYAAAHLPDLVRTALSSGQEPGNALVFAVERLGQALMTESSGAVAVVFLLTATEIAAANAGDARALLVRDGTARQLTVDHRVHDPRERERILEAGGRIAGSYVMNGPSGLMPTRSLGDADFLQVGVTFSPYVQTTARSSSDEWLITACDGLFDVMANDEVAETIRGADDAQAAVERLGHEVLIVRQGMDNLTIVAVDLR